MRRDIRIYTVMAVFAGLAFATVGEGNVSAVTPTEPEAGRVVPTPPEPPEDYVAELGVPLEQVVEGETWQKDPDALMAAADRTWKSDDGGLIGEFDNGTVIVMYTSDASAGEPPRSGAIPDLSTAAMSVTYTVSYTAYNPLNHYTWTKGTVSVYRSSGCSTMNNILGALRRRSCEIWCSWQQESGSYFDVSPGTTVSRTYYACFSGSHDWRTKIGATTAGLAESGTVRLTNSSC